MATPRRRFTLMDAMILVAATAAGCALIRYYWNFYGGWPRDGFSLFGWAMTSACFLSPLSFALIVLRMRTPRPTRTRLRRQPGLVSNLVVMLGWFIYGGLAAWAWLRRIAGRDISSPDPDLDLLIVIQRVHSCTELVGWMVAASWFALVLAGACRPEPSWIDRAGRILGACWIAIAVLLTFPSS